MLLCTLIQICYTQLMYFYDDNGLIRIHDTYFKNYAFPGEPFNDELFLNTIYFPKKRSNDDTIRFMKRLIALPRVGRR